MKQIQKFWFVIISATNANLSSDLQKLACRLCSAIVTEASIRGDKTDVLYKYLTSSLLDLTHVCSLVSTLPPSLSSLSPQTITPFYSLSSLFYLPSLLPFYLFLFISFFPCHLSFFPFLLSLSLSSSSRSKHPPSLNLSQLVSRNGCKVEKKGFNLFFNSML